MVGSVRSKTQERELDAYLELWARWVHSGAVRRSTSIMQIIMEQGSFARGCSGSRALVTDCVELTIESSLLRLKEQNKDAVIVCRYEYGALIIKNLPVEAKRVDRALRLGMSLRTYNRRLAEAREWLTGCLIASGDMQ